ncbi:MAG: metalloregulator ArsR/SmtB family transcription factor [Comamonadaceae bacterium]|nr:MAG: metalloregulator ArsR/SmtB family transcription factor [Comamonadaceae bacterium]
MRALKDTLYEQVARVAKALASPKRLELLELLCQGEKAVETLAASAGISVKLASAHLRELRLARLVDTRKDGKYVLYRLADASVADLWVALREQAQERLVELQVALASVVDHADDLQGVDRKSILKRAKAGEVLILDVRATEEYEAGHLPHAQSLPVGDLRKRLAEIPKDVPVVAYCRGPFCFMAKDAVKLLRSRGYQAFHLRDGVAEWRAHGLPVEAGS